MQKNKQTKKITPPKNIKNNLPAWMDIFTDHFEI